MIARTSFKSLKSKTIFNKIISTKKFYSSYNDSKEKKLQQEPSTKSDERKKNRIPPNVPSFMPVVNIPVTELAHSAFYSLHRPLFGLSTPRPFLAGNMVGQIKKEESDSSSKEALLQYMMTLRPFEPPGLDSPNKEEKSSTTTLTVEIDPSYFLNHNNNHDEIADYLTAMQEKLDILYDERTAAKSLISRKKIRRLRKRKGFFEKN
ncbi:hypothetical protein CU098_012253 [Rhizopus stolonifer]|uniref:Mitochondrial mRNA-processing protein COX24 C-terminal domain-containing protein n=2 Tax=Mucorineae TaxID=1344963 RepID=A0A367KJB9_RHIST|nr:hypothetical protein CU098_012253 [Rhizopus stolonifer]